MATVPPPSAVRESEPAAPAAIDRPALIAGGFLPLRPARFLIGLGTGMATVSKESAAQNQIGDSGLTFNGTLGFTIYDVFMISGSFSGVFPSDKASFSQEVVPVMGGGDPQSASSSVSVVSYAIAVDLRTPFWALGSTNNGWVVSALFAGYGAAGISAGRSISHCVDCRKDDLNIPGGSFWQVGIDLLIPARRPSAFWGLTIAYQRYAAGAGLTDEVRVGVNGWL